MPSSDGPVALHRIKVPKGQSSPALVALFSIGLAKFNRINIVVPNLKKDDQKNSSLHRTRRCTGILTGRLVSLIINLYYYRGKVMVMDFVFLIIS